MRRSPALLAFLVFGFFAVGRISLQAEMLTLSHCLEIAAQSNPDLREASTGFKDAEGQSIQLHAIFYPRLKSQAILVPPTVYVQVDQYIYNPAMGPQLALSRLTRQQAVLNYQQTLVEVVYQVRQQFATALAQQNVVEILERHYDQFQRMIPGAKQLYEAGKLHQSELLHLQVRDNLARQRLASARSSYHQALLALELLLGKKLDDKTHLEGTLGDDDIPELNAKKLTEEALRNRPDLQALQTQKLAQSQRLALSTSSFYPTVGASSDSAFALPFPVGVGGYDLNRNFDEIGAQRPNGTSQVPLSLYFYWTFFDGGKTWGTKRSGEAQLASQAETLAALKNAIPGQIERAADTLQNAADALKTLAAAPTGEQLRTNAELDFNAGKIHLLDKSQIEDSILYRERSELAARLKVTLTVAALDHVLGRVVQFDSGKNSDKSSP